MCSLIAVPATTAAAAGTSSITGTVFQDANRNGVLDVGESPWVNHQLYLFNTSGAYVMQAFSDAAGHYTMSGLSDGAYTLAYASPSWSAIRGSWAPTTTGSVYPQVAVNLSGSRVVDFGWRTITWSTDLNAPSSSYVGANGLRTESFNDAVDAHNVYDAVMRGSLIGPEASHTIVRMGYGDVSEAPTSIGQSNGLYSLFTSTPYITWSAWLDDRDATIFHEYGHSWSLYNDYLVRQDGTFSGYIQARGLSGDARVGTSYKWSPGEMIAEDYRQLFGTPEGQARPQANNEIPPAAQVAGLRDFLATTYTQPATPPPPPPPPPPTLAVSGLSMSPTTVTKSGTVAFTLSAPASVTIEILDAGGTAVAPLLSGVSKPAGSVSALWNRTSSDGRRAKSGSYSVRVTATASGAAPAIATVSFSVR